MYVLPPTDGARVRRLTPQRHPFVTHPPPLPAPQRFPLCTVYPAMTLSCPNITAEQNKAIVSASAKAGGGSGTGYTYTASGLPSSLSMSTAGAVTGTPTVSSSTPYIYNVTAKDSVGQNITVSCSVTVAAVLATPTCPTIKFEAGVAVTAYQNTATTGVAPYTYSISSGALPAGLILTSTTGAIIGTPTASSGGFRISVVDAVGVTKTSVSCSGTGQALVLLPSCLPLEPDLRPVLISLTSSLNVMLHSGPRLADARLSVQDL